MLTYINTIHAQKKMQKLSEYTASNGITYEIGDRLKMRHGAAANGDFLSLIEGIGASSTNRLGAVHSNFIFSIKKIRSWNLSSYKGVTFVLGGGGMAKNSIDIELAIQNCEITDCEPSTQSTNSIKKVETSLPNQEIDKYDKLRKIKKLYDEGVLTEQEFLEEKKKILNH